MRIGIVGAGQLGRMLGIAGLPLGLDFRFLDPGADPPAAAVGDIIRAAFDDESALRRLAAECDVLTYEFENVSVEQLCHAAGDTPIFPPPSALAAAQDRRHEKEAFAAAGIPVADWRSVDSREDLEAAVSALGAPLVLKTRRFGYDGKGQHRIHSTADVAEAWAALGGVPLIAERLVAFEREVSAIGVSDATGDVRFYPIVENVHRQGILHTSRAPLSDRSLQRQAERSLRALLDRLRYRGIIAVEFFVLDGELIGNEFAPRVHNSGHWTIEGANCSQFENHLRAICGLPLGDCTPIGHSGMLNLIGRLPPAADLLAVRGAHLHDYRKQARPGRKLGHVTVVAGDPAGRDSRLAALEALTLRHGN